MGTVEEGARNAVTTCMNVQPGETVIIVTDREVPEVGDALEKAARDVTPNVHRFVLEDYGERPLTAVPREIAETAERADVSFWAAASAQGELPVRMAYRKHITHARHGHMPGISRLLMETGMNADYDAVADLTMKLHARVQGVRRAVVKSAYGTDFEVVFHPEWKWLPDTGKFHTPGSWGNLPAGEVYTAPAWLHGTLVTHLLGDYFSEKYGKLDEPLRFDVHANRIVLDSVTGGTPDVREDFRKYVLQDPMGTRASEFAMGTNIGLTDVVGNLLQDEKIPGVHVAFGHPYTDQTGAPWTADTHVDVVMLDTDVWLDGEQVQVKGDYRL